MSCSSFDWKAYALGELDAAGRRQAEAHASTCEACREEVAGIRLTLDALSTLSEEEIPRRIGFVSDKVFAPRWWSYFLRPSFAAASVVAVAILAHGFMVRAGQRPANVAVVASVDTAALEARIQKEVNVRIEDAVNRAIAQSESRQAERVAAVLATAEKRYTNLLQAKSLTAEEDLRMVTKQYQTAYAINTGIRQ